MISLPVYCLSPLPKGQLHEMGVFHAISVVPSRCLGQPKYLLNDCWISLQVDIEMEVILKKFHLSLCHQARLAPPCRFLFCDNLSAEIKIPDVLKKKKKWFDPDLQIFFC